MPAAVGVNDASNKCNAIAVTTAVSTTKSSMSAPSSSLASPSLSSLSLDAILEELTVIATSAKALEARRQTLLDALDQLVETGEADEQLSWNDFTITRRVRTSYTYPLSIVQQREQLKAAEKIAVALGDADTKLTTFWEVRAPKP